MSNRFNYSLQTNVCRSIDKTTIKSGCLKLFKTIRKWLGVGWQYVDIAAELSLSISLASLLLLKLPEKQEQLISITFGCALTLLLLTALLRYKSGRVPRLVPTLWRLWLGYLLGLSMWTPDNDVYTEANAKRVLEAFVVVSPCLSLISSLAARWQGAYIYSPVFLPSTSIVECLGLCASLASLDTEKGVPLFILLCALFVSAGAVRSGSYLALLNSALCLGLGLWQVFHDRSEVQWLPVCIFVVRLLLQPLLDVAFCSVGGLIRWDWLLLRGRPARLLLWISFIALQITYIALLATYIPTHKEWYIVVFIFTAGSIFWLCFHTLFLVSLWKVNVRLSQCNMFYACLPQDGRDRMKVLENAGMRYVALVAHRSCGAALCSTLLVGILSWETRRPASVALFLLLWNLESLLLSMLSHLGTSLSGTGIAYALMVPAYTPGTTQQVGSPIELERLNTHSTRTLGKIQSFFSHVMFDTFACDYSTSGLTYDALEIKLKAFFGSRTVNGPRYDTYFLYFSGPTNMDSGNWTLPPPGEVQLTATQLIQWWQERNLDSHSRLILFCDGIFSFKWRDEIKKAHNVFVAMQYFHRRFPEDMEESQNFRIGALTSDWIQHNTAPASDKPKESSEEDVDSSGRIDWRYWRRPYVPMYCTSKHYHRFRFSEPSQQDMESFISSHSVLKHGKSLLYCTRYLPCTLLRSGAASDCIVTCFRKFKLKLWRPYELDTGHGFHLIRT